MQHELSYVSYWTLIFIKQKHKESFVLLQKDTENKE